MISIGQGCPNASLEAMSAGLPVVANDDGGTREQVIDGVTGRLVPTLPDRELVESLARALADVLNDPARSGRMGRAGRDRVRALFSMKRMADGYLSILQKPEDCRWSVPS
jgi:glycosyltransferase involved in cell wall biosynthesis